MTRKFWLMCGNTTIALNNETGILLTNPTGLGVTFDNQYAEVNDGFFYNKQQKQKQGSVACTLNFFKTATNGGAYAAYSTFANTVLMASQIVLQYSPDGGTTIYNCKADINYLTKGESNDNKVLSVPASFLLKGLWYRDTTIASVESTVTVTNNGKYPASFQLYTLGTLAIFQNPKITIKDSSQTIIGKIELTTSIIRGDALLYSNDFDDSYVRIYRANTGIEDAIYCVDPLKPVFPRAYSSEYTIEVTDDNSRVESFSIRQREYWRTV